MIESQEQNFYSRIDRRIDRFLKERWLNKMGKNSDQKILLAHGSGGKLSHQLIEDVFLPHFKNPLLEPLDDGALLKIPVSEIVVTTDSYVVDPIFFPGGDIGKLAASGTINDLAVMGAIPRYLTLGLMLEEGLALSDLEKILQSIQTTCDTAGVEIVTGDTKVVPRGAMDKIFINTSGVGEIREGFRPVGPIKTGDKILINGTIGDHGTIIMASREGLNLTSPLISDCAPLNGLISTLFKFGEKIRMMRDPTRGGVATVLNEIISGLDFGILVHEDQFPIKEEVKSLCEILGLDPLYLANEGKVIVVVDGEVADEVLSIFQSHPLGSEACLIGEVVTDFPGKVVLQTNFGSRRIVDMLTGEQLPRIC